MSPPDTPLPAEVLLVDDSPDDVALTRAALRAAKVLVNLSVVPDGEQALAFLRREGSFAQAPRPSLVLLDLNMPRMDGRTTLAEIRKDPQLRATPVVILTSSEAETDILTSYELGANCFVTKPVGLEQFQKVVKAMDDFWLCVAQLPKV